MSHAKLYRIRERGPWYALHFDFESRRWLRRSTGHKTEAAARKVADAWLREGEDLQSGVTSSAQHHRGRGLDRHIEDFVTARAARRGAKAKHVEETRRRLERVAKEAGWDRLDAIDLDALHAALGRISDQFVAEQTKKREARWKKACENAERMGPLGPARPPRPGKPDPLTNATLNAFRRAWRSFTRWCHRSGRLTTDPLAEWERLPTDGFESFSRRALTWAEFELLFTATKTGPVREGIPGEDRAMLYLAAVGTGFRLNELTSLTPGSFLLDRSPPVVRLGAEWAKNDKPVLQPIPRRDIEAFRGWLVGRRRGERLWPTLDSGAAMLQADLAAAGVSVVDQDGARADFHALRHTFGTWLALGGVMPQLCQRLMRHSTMDLTLKLYTHLGLADLDDAVQRSIGSTRCAGAAQKPVASHDETDARSTPDEVLTRGDDGSQPTEGDAHMAPDETKQGPDMAPHTPNARRRIRTVDLPLRSEQVPPLKRLAPQAHARDESGSAAPALRAPGKDPSKPAHARERAEAGLEPDLDTAFARMRELSALGLDDLRRQRSGGAA